MPQQAETDVMATVTDETFTQTVLANEQPVVVYFWATWCPSCKRIATSLTELAQELGDRLVFAKLNADDNPAIVRAHNVLSLPTLLTFRGGEITGSIVGARPKSSLRQALLDHAGL